MTRQGPPGNLAASVRARLLNLSRERKQEFQLVLAEFAIERLLYRLGVSEYKDRFVLKGAMLFKLWSDESRRATWDLDLLGRGASGVADVTAKSEVGQIVAASYNCSFLKVDESIHADFQRDCGT